MVERKHGYILDVTHIIMLQMHVPKFLWFNAVLIASYVINRMPSGVLRGVIPLRRMRPDIELFHVPPKVFGCVVLTSYHSVPSNVLLLVILVSKWLSVLSLSYSTIFYFY